MPVVTCQFGSLRFCSHHVFYLVPGRTGGETACRGSRGQRANVVSVEGLQAVCCEARHSQILTVCLQSQRLMVNTVRVTFPQRDGGEASH